MRTDNSIRRFVLSTMFAGALISVGAAQTVSQTVRHHKVAEEDPVAADLAKAEAAIESKDYAAAGPLLNKIVAADAGNYAAWFDLGFVYNAQGKTDDAIAAYRKSVAAKPDVFESNLNLGLMLAKTKQPDAAQFLRTATTLKPTANTDEGHARAWLSLAHVVEDSKPEEALAAYRQAATLQPKDPEPHLSAAGLLEKQGQYADAEQECNQALALDPSSSQALTCVAEMQLRAKHYPEAEQTLRKILATQPNDVATKLQLGRVLEIAGKNDEAIAALESALKLDSTNANVQSDLATLYEKMGKFAQAEPLYRALLAQNPNEAELHARLAHAYLKQLKYAQAEQELLVAVRLRPDFGEAYGELATAADENKDYELAIRAVDVRDKLLPPLPVGYFLRASAFDHLRDYKQAALNYHRFLELANGKYPDQEWQARHRLIAIEPKK